MELNRSFLSSNVGYAPGDSVSLFNSVARIRHKNIAVVRLYSMLQIFIQIKTMGKKGIGQLK